MKTAVTFILLTLSSVSLAAKPNIYCCDVRYALGLSSEQCYDIQHVAACLQGIVNRDAPRIFMLYQYGYDYINVSGDQLWYDRLLESGGLCEGWTVQNTTDLKSMILKFKYFIKGVVVYEPNAETGVRSTSLAATTAAACEDALPVRKDTSAGSLYNWLVNDSSGPKFPVLIDLTDKFTGTGIVWGTTVYSSGSKKCDAYLWAKENYLKTGKCNPAELNYTLDMWGLKANLNILSQLCNLDFAVRNKAFCLDLSPWSDEAPSDDPTQPLGTDYGMYIQILEECNNQLNKSKMIHLCGFPPFPWKYTTVNNHSTMHTDLETEAWWAQLISAYNCYYDADPQCWIANGSFYAGLSPIFTTRRFVQNPPYTYSRMVSDGLINNDGTVPPGNYIYMYLGDYDSSSWILYSGAGTFYNDSNRGSINLNWSLLPIATERASVAVDYMYRHKTSKDFFVAPCNGAAGAVPFKQFVDRSPSNYPSCIPMWQKICKDRYRVLDISITGFLVDHFFETDAADFANYSSFSGDGIFTNYTSPSIALYNNIPVCEIGANSINGYLDYFKDENTVSIVDYSSGVNFSWYRTILWSPTRVKTLEDRYASRNNHRFPDAYTFGYLLRYYLSGRQQSSNYFRATWAGDTIPSVMACGQTYSAKVTVRNDGWDTWSDSAGYKLAYAIVPRGTKPEHIDYGPNGRFKISGSTTVASSESYVFDVNIVAPETPGTYDIYYDMVKNGVTWFKDANNVEWKSELAVANKETDIDTDGDGTPDVNENANGTYWWHPDDCEATPPGGTFVINSGAAYTNSRAVTLMLSAEDEHGIVSQMRFSNDNINWSAWENYNGTKSWTILSGTGTKTVYAQYKDAAGNISQSAFDSIYLDSNRPTGSIVINFGNTATFTTAVMLSLNASDVETGVAEMRFYTNALGDWVPYSTSYKIDIPTTSYETKTIRVQFRDGAGNISSNYSDSIILTQKGDFDGNLSVALRDLGIFANWWLMSCRQNNCEAVDINQNGIVDLQDLAELAANW